MYIHTHTHTNKACVPVCSLRTRARYSSELSFLEFQSFLDQRRISCFRYGVTNHFLRSPFLPLKSSKTEVYHHGPCLRLQMGIEPKTCLPVQPRSLAPPPLLVRHFHHMPHWEHMLIRFLVDLSLFFGCWGVLRRCMARGEGLLLKQVSV